MLGSLRNGEMGYKGRGCCRQVGMDRKRKDRD